jgi:hypothetical protein
MKKFISGLIAAFVLSAGFVAVSAETAQAACSPSKYTQCPTTKTKATGSKSVRAGKKPKTVVKVQAAGNVKPKGTVTITYTGPGGFKKTITVKYNGKTISAVGPKLKKKGTYKVTVSFKGTNAKDSKSKYTIKVK